MIGLVIGAALAFYAPPSFAASPTLDGINAVPDAAPGIAGKLVATPAKNGAQSLDFIFMRAGDAKAITTYDVELTKQLHVIAVSDDFRSFLHDHVTRVANDGHFRLSMSFPEAGLYHIYADLAPTGLGQQVLRFDLPVGTTRTDREPAGLAATGLQASDVAYSVTFDSLDLTAGQEASLTLHVAKWGKPATDLRPFLGVAAHAVFIDTDDLSYLHVHASPSPAKAEGATAHHMNSMQGMSDMSIMDMGSTAPMPSSTKLGPDLSLHVAPPKPGNYALWIQFMGGGEVRTVAFIVTVK